jgi:hypothetical protein
VAVPVTVAVVVVLVVTAAACAGEDRRILKRPALGVLR